MRMSPVFNTSFGTPTPRPTTPQEWADASLARIDTSKDNIVLYLDGGTGWTDNPSDVRTEISPYITAPNTEVAEVHYDHSDPRASVVSKAGVDVASILIPEIMRRNPAARIYLSGHSMGAWSAGDVLANPAVAQAVRGAALLGHIMLAEHHYPTDTGAIREFNNVDDRLTMPYAGPRDEMMWVADTWLTRDLTDEDMVRAKPTLDANPELWQQMSDVAQGKDIPHRHIEEIWGPAFTWLNSRIEADSAAAAGVRALVQHHAA